MIDFMVLTTLFTPFILRAHNGEKVGRAIEAKGWQLLFLSCHSPGYPPIIIAFSKLKTSLGRTGARKYVVLQEAICQACLTFQVDSLKICTSPSKQQITTLSKPYREQLSCKSHH